MIVWLYEYCNEWNIAITFKGQPKSSTTTVSDHREYYSFKNWPVEVFPRPCTVSDTICLWLQDLNCCLQLAQNAWIFADLNIKFRKFRWGIGVASHEHWDTCLIDFFSNFQLISVPHKVYHSRPCLVAYPSTVQQYLPTVVYFKSTLRTLGFDHQWRDSSGIYFIGRSTVAYNLCCNWESVYNFIEVYNCVSILRTGWAKKPDLFMKVCNSCMCRHRIAIYIPNCSVLHPK